MAAGLAPATVLFALLYLRDRRREPAGPVLVTLVLGVAIAGPALPIEIGIDRLGVALGLIDSGRTRTLMHAAFDAFLVTALVEEVLKFAVLWLYGARRSAFDEPMDGIVYGAAASLGFAATENVLYVMRSWTGDGGSAEQSLSVALSRALSAVPMHATFGVVMGACIGISRFTPHRRMPWVALGLAGAIGLHGLYNFTTTGMGVMHLQDEGVGMGIAFLARIAVLCASMMVAVLALARLRRDQEVAMSGGRLPPVHAPRLPMATCIAAAASAAIAAIAVAAWIAVMRGQAQRLPIDESLAVALTATSRIGLQAASATAAVAVVVGTVSLARQRRWRAATVTAMVLAAWLGTACGLADLPDLR